MANNERNGRKIMVERKMDDAPIAVETMTNRSSGERQIQLNSHYLKANMTEPAYGAKNININIIDIPDIVVAIVELYNEETGKKLELE